MLYFYFISLHIPFLVGYQIYRDLKKTSAIGAENTHTARRAFTAASPETAKLKVTYYWQKQLPSKLTWHQDGALNIDCKMYVV
jgi:hypothetical protein